MKNILYMGIAHPSNHAIAVFSRSLLKSLRLSHYNIHVYGDESFLGYFENPETISLDDVATMHWDIVIIQNSLCFTLYAEIMRSLRKVPVIFVSNTDDFTGYVAPFDNLYAVLSTVEANLTHWNIPTELCKPVKIPVTASGNYYRYDNRPDCYELVYCPARNSNARIDRKILNLADIFNCRLTIAGEEYRTLKSAMNSNVRIISRRQSTAVFKKAHLVMASGEQAIQAIALCKPCLIAGDHGLGGKVTVENYGFFKRYGFRGRAGASSDEHIPLDLLLAEIQQTLAVSCEKEMKNLHDLVLAEGYSFNSFHRIITQTIDQVLKLYEQLRDRRLHRTLKPRLADTFNIRRINDQNFIVRGNIRFSEVDDDLLALLRQCNGAQTVEDIMIKNGYSWKDTDMFAGNIVELWKEKLVVFSSGSIL